MGFDWSRYKSDFMKFEDVGDSISGAVLGIEMGTDYNGNPCPLLIIGTEDGARKVTAGQVMLQAALAEKGPAEGDHLTITYYANGEAKQGRNPAKLFKVDVKRGAAVTADDLA